MGELLRKDGAVGRPERSIDPSEGPIQAFAAELRDLRERAGRPKYAVLAQRSGRSQTTLSEAAGGRRLPTLDTVEAFVRACHGDIATFRRSWHETARSLGQTPETGQEPENEPENEPGTPVNGDSAATAPVNASRSGDGRRRPILLVWLAAVLVLVATVVTVVVAQRSGPDPVAERPGEPAISGPVGVDEADPKDSGCAADPRLDSIDIVEVGPAGRPVGRLELRYSPMCGVAWPRFVPAAGAVIPAGTAVQVDAVRPADGRRASFTAPYAGTEIFGNQLRSTKDCVRAEVHLAAATDATVSSACYRGAVKVPG